MWRPLPLIALLGVVLAAPALGSPIPSKTAITGFAPYVLGTGTRAVLAADPELAPGNYPAWTNTLLTQRYGRSIVAPIGGINYVATLGVQFWQGRLAVVILKWPTTAFDSASDWRHAAEILHKRITGAYTNEGLPKPPVNSSSVWMLDVTDEQGNALSAWSGDRPFDLTMVYLWAPFAKALESAPAPESNY